MATKIKLDIIDDYVSVLYGIAAQELDYKLALAINEKLHISMKCSTPIMPADISDPEIFFTKFSYQANDGDMSIDLVSNRYANNYLLGKLKNIDFLFVIRFPESDEFVSRCISCIREIPEVISVFEIDIKQQKDKRIKLLDL